MPLSRKYWTEAQLYVGHQSHFFSSSLFEEQRKCDFESKRWLWNHLM